MDAALRDLEEWLRIPSVSGDPSYAGAVGAATAWVARRLRRGGSTVHVRGTTRAPVVLAHRPGRDPRSGTLVVYGHLDVRPAGPGWTSPPFTPTQRGHRLVARGASDDKGQLMAHLAALDTWAARGGAPVGVLTVVDGAEEVGSPTLAAALRGPLPRLVLGVVVVDTRGAGPGWPTLTVSQRGSVPVRVVVDVGGAPVHAGRLGGAVVDPTLVLARALLRAERAVRALPGPPPAPYPSDAAVRATAGGRAVHADAAARATVRGAVGVTRVHAAAAAGAVPVRVVADLDVRLPPGVPATVVRPLLERAVGPHVTVQVAHGTTGRLVRPPADVLAAVRTACVAAYGRAPVHTASGGSIPAVALLARRFGQDPALLGLAPADDGAHGPDEHLDLRAWPAMVGVHVALLAAFGAGRQPPVRASATPVRALLPSIRPGHVGTRVHQPLSGG